ncbi:MAG: acetyltransferase [Kiritimatiellae bacterium]|nr:acetyltransferase [Kiritimatiellia bacterium]
MKHLVIIGAGGFGREMFGAAREAVGYGALFDVKGFLDARPGALDAFAGYPPVVGDPAAYTPAPDDVFITALGDIAARRRCAEAVEKRGGRFISVVHRSAAVGPNVAVGEGSFVAANAVLTADVKVGRHVAVFHGSSVGHDSVLCDFCHVYAQCAIGGGVTVGEGAAVYPGAVVVPRRRIGAGAVVGAGSTVFLNVEDGARVFGSPAAPVR